MNEKTGLFQAYALMWKKIFVYKDSANRREYWFPILINAVVALLMFGAFWITYLNGFRKAAEIILIVAAVYLGVCLVPLVALTVRRLHDTGRRGWWAFLMLAVGIGTIWLMCQCAAAAASAGFNSSENYQECVYGPPSWMEEYNPENNSNPGVYGPADWEPEYETADNMTACVYGPPDWMAELEPAEEELPETEPEG